VPVVLANIFQNIKLTFKSFFQKTFFEHQIYISKNIFQKLNLTSEKYYPKAKFDFLKIFFESHFSHP